jgi:hypothetical protein
MLKKFDFLSRRHHLVILMDTPQIIQLHGAC